jgi:hypothetical protein
MPTALHLKWANIFTISAETPPAVTILTEIVTDKELSAETQCCAVISAAAVIETEIRSTPSHYDQSSMNDLLRGEFFISLADQFISIRNIMC